MEDEKKQKKPKMNPYEFFMQESLKKKTRETGKSSHKLTASKPLDSEESRAVLFDHIFSILNPQEDEEITS